MLLLAIHGAKYLVVDLKIFFSVLRLLSPLCTVAQCLPLPFQLLSMLFAVTVLVITQCCANNDAATTVACRCCYLHRRLIVTFLFPPVSELSQAPMLNSTSAAGLLSLPWPPLLLPLLLLPMLLPPMLLPPMLLPPMLPPPPLLPPQLLLPPLLPPPLLPPPLLQLCCCHLCCYGFLLIASVAVATRFFLSLPVGCSSCEHRLLC